MKNVAISDIHDISRIWKYNLENKSSEHNIIAYVTQRDHPPKMLDGIPVLNMMQFVTFYKKGLIEEFILPQERYTGWSKIIEELISLGVQK